MKMDRKQGTKNKGQAQPREQQHSNNTKLTSSTEISQKIRSTQPNQLSTTDQYPEPIFFSK